ncbi:hypothetical protein KUTeg_010879 [Tegillarca granosa]|uniref:Uncharacterized protein n=1 Tax=Tegillarca granosa TaxID=220873 RepID=A0ABQ9F297_TEGGR|nr:hypothetical protein KUTeg_010879 [Tegillarca granosa]
MVDGKVNVVIDYFGGSDGDSISSITLVSYISSVGKTSVVIRYVGGMFSKAVSPTIGASFFTYKLNVNNYRVKLQVWDTAGQERFRAMAPMYYRKANAAMLVYDMTSSDSFYDIKDWVKLKRNVDTPLVLTLVGNKSDLTDRIDEAFLQVAQQLIQLYETSPNSGLSSIDTQVPSTDNTNDSEDTNIKIQPKPGTKSQESAQSSLPI